MPDYETAAEQSALAEAKSQLAKYHAHEASKFVEIADTCAQEGDLACEAAALEAAKNHLALGTGFAQEAKAAMEAAKAALEEE